MRNIMVLLMLFSLFGIGAGSEYQFEEFVMVTFEPHNEFKVMVNGVITTGLAGNATFLANTSSTNCGFETGQSLVIFDDFKGNATFKVMPNDRDDYIVITGIEIDHKEQEDLIAKKKMWFNITTQEGKSTLTIS